MYSISVSSENNKKIFDTKVVRNLMIRTIFISTFYWKIDSWRVIITCRDQNSGLLTG